MFPEGFIKRIKTQKHIDAGMLLESLRSPSPVSIRINPVKWNQVPADSTPVPWCSTGYYISERPSFTADPLFHAGCYYPQEASGMFLEEIFRQLFSGKKNLRVLDLCAAPGSKSTHLSTLLADNGCLIANEVIRARVSVLAENITRWGIPNTIVTNNDPADFSKLKGYFDFIVVDAPCSGEGMFRDPETRKEWSENNAALCSKRQRRIISEVWPALKENGILIYSTCTFNPAENEENIKWLTDNTISECVRIDVSRFPQITEISYEGITGYGFYPYKSEGDGFFISVVRKKESSDAVKFRLNKKAIPVPARVQKTAEKITGISTENIYMVNQIVYHTPFSTDEMSFLSSMLKVIRPGTDLFRDIGGEIVPEHGLALTVLLKKGVYPMIELNYLQALSYLRKDNIDVPLTGKGWYTVAYEGCNLGFVKSTGTRLNNLFPVQLRIRMSLEALSGKQTIKWCM